MGRSALAVVCISCVVFAAVAGPLTHVHDDVAEPDGHHRGRVVHAHTGGHAHTAPALDRDHPAIAAASHDHDDDVYALNAFQMVGSWTKPVLGLTPAAVPPLASPVRFVPIRPPVQRGHDPPITRVDSPRGPPSFLS